ncbi:MAG: hypothetical protein ACREYA_18720, partial [Cupriavidus necator]
AMTRISTACSWVSIGSPEKAAILAQVGQIYFGAVGQFYIGANKRPLNHSFEGGRGLVRQPIH